MGILEQPTANHKKKILSQNMFFLQVKAAACEKKRLCAKPGCNISHVISKLVFFAEKYDEKPFAEMVLLTQVDRYPELLKQQLVSDKN
jgi:hypothetical protein